MKVSLRIPRPSKKLFLIVGGVAFLTSLAGGVAAYLGKDRLFGSAVQTASVLACTDVNLVKVSKRNHNWIRKYIRTASTDGMSRVRTGLREALSVAKHEKAGLIQVIVLDEKGPSLRSEIGSRAEGAEVIYVPDPSRLPNEVKAPVYSARYYDGGASSDGMFFGERIEVPEDQIAALAQSVSLAEAQDCVDPTIVAATEGGEGKAEGKGKGKKAKAGKEEGAEGEGAKEAGAKGEGAGGDGANAEAAGQGGHGSAPREAPAESGEAKTEAAPAEAPAEGH